MDKKPLNEGIQRMVDENVMPVGVVSTTPYKTQRNAHLFPVQGEENNLPSMTIPDQSLTTQELLYRFTHGLSLGGAKAPIYEDEGDLQFPANWDKMDLSEKHDFIDSKRDEFNALQEKLLIAKNEMIEKKRQEEVDKAVEEKVRKIRESRKDLPNENEPK